MLPEQAKKYLLHGLSGTPVVLDKLMAGATPEDHDRRPDPERFTLREVVAHLADWEPIWLERVEGLATQDHPTLQGYDEGQLALDRDYARADVAAQIARFRAGRGRLREVVHRLPEESWGRTGYHTEWGEIDITSLLTLILGHDGYHMKQVAEWLGNAR